MRLVAAAAVVALAGGLAAAAYLNVLPAPVQRVVHDAFRFANVPPASGHHHGGARAKTHGQHRPPQPGHPGASAPPASSGKPAAGPSHRPGGSPSASPSPAPSPSATGPAVLTESASSTDLPAGSPVVIDGQLTRSGSGVAGVAVTLREHKAGRPGWKVAGSAQTNTDGNVAVTVSALTTNAAFRLTAAGVHSPAVHVVVIPQVSIVLTAGPRGLRDRVNVSTDYARPGNRVVLQVQTASGWTTLRQKRLSPAGLTHFFVNGNRRQHQALRVVLLATARHGPAISNSVTVPAI